MANYFKILNSAYVGIGSFIFFRQVDKAFHLSNYVRELRVLYFISQLIIFGINLLIIRKIRQINDTTTLIYVQPASKRLIGKPTDEKQVNTTIKDYDLAEVHKGLKQAVISIIILMILHIKFGLVPPLFGQSIMGIKGCLTTKEAQIHIWKSFLTEELQRPFKDDSILSKLSKGKKDTKTNAENENEIIETLLVNKKLE